MAAFPVIAWNAFIEHIRVNVNPLAADDHMKEVCILYLLGCPLKFKMADHVIWYTIFIVEHDGKIDFWIDG